MEENRYLEILEKYRETFGQLPVLPIMGNYGSIINEMEEAIIRKSPLTPDEVWELFKGEEIDLAEEIKN